MRSVLAALRHPAALALALLLGTAVGLALPGAGEDLTHFGQAYLALLNMAATPLIVVAVFFGLRRILSLPRAGLRLGALLGMGLGALLLGGLLAAVLASLWGAGSGLTQADAQVLGRLSLDHEAFTSVNLLSPDTADGPDARWNAMVPDNYYQALAFGSLPAILIGTLCFGFALAVQEGESARAFQRLMEAIYRTLEQLIERLNVFLPLMAFALAASLASQASWDWVRLMSGFLGPFLLTGGLVVAACVCIAARHLGVGPEHVLRGLRRPFVVGLFSGGSAAAVPGFIDAMCNQLGFRRDLVEFAAPVAPVFLRVGDAVFFAVLVVFVANLYGRAPDPADLALIGLASAAAALSSVAFVGGRSLAAGALLLGWLDLPAEALLPAFVVIEVLCEGLRTLLALALTCALVALVSRGLPSEAQAVATLFDAAQRKAGLRLVLGPRQALAVGLLLTAALGTACLAGIGLGLRQASSTPIQMVGVP